jgi:UDP-MurNAc hydroxylase
LRRIARPVIRFVGHASFVIEGAGASLLSDPWLAGTAFNDGWELLAPAYLDSEMRSNITDLFISHEHPDHFSPPALKSLKGDGGPTVRVQHTRDGRVAQYCRSQGFDVAELPNHERVALADNFEVVCGQHRHMDSWLLADVGGVRLLNVNDCSITDRAQAHRIRSITGPIDVLFTQFSYANWVGNPDERERRARYAQEILSYVRAQIEVLEPRYVVPFASFIRFCHEENAYLNDALPSLREVTTFITRETKAIPIAMYPGDAWSPGEAYDNEPALGAYDTRLAEPVTLRSVSRSFDVDELQDLAQRQRQRLEERNHMGALRLLEASRYLTPVCVLLTDIGRTVEVRCGRPLTETSEAPHVEMSSDSLAFAFANDFGAETLYVNGRYRVHRGSERLFFRHFYPAILNNQGFSFPVGAVDFLFREKLSWRARAARAALRKRAVRPRVA